MSQPIAALTPVNANGLTRNFLAIAESIGNNPETCKTTLGDIRDWIEVQFSGASYSFNLWDEQWEKGSINNSSGQPTTSNDWMRSKNYIEVNPNLRYYCKTNSSNLIIHEYDENGTNITYQQNITNKAFVVGNTTKLIKFNWKVGSEGQTYQNNICINIYNTSKNGQYEPYGNSIADTPTFLRPEKIKSSGINISQTINSSSEILLNFDIPEYLSGKTYQPKDLIRYNNCIYYCLNQTSNPPTNTLDWLRLNYTGGRRINISDTNIISSLGGIEVWQENTDYNINDFVIYEKKLFQCMIANNDAEWDKTKWLNIGEGNGIIIYEDNKTYDAGAIVLKDRKLYQKLTFGTPITWDPNDWVCISNGNYSQFYIKYSHIEPQSDSDMKDTPDEYIGIYVGPVESPPTSYQDYTWYQFKGADGTINVEANTVVIYATLLATDWEDTSGAAPYTQTITDSALLATMAPIVDVNLSNNSSTWEDEKANFGLISKAECDNGSITFYCLEAPNADINVKIRLQGDVNANSFVTKAEFNALKAEIETANSALQSILEGN